jgi:hypothetical protein
MRKKVILTFVAFVMLGITTAFLPFVLAQNTPLTPGSQPVLAAPGPARGSMPGTNPGTAGLGR